MTLREEVLKGAGIINEEKIVPNKRISHKEFTDIMTKRCEDVKSGKEKDHLVGYIVYKPNTFSWNDKYNDLEDRTMVVSSSNKIYDRDAGGYSLFGKILSGGPRDIVRIERIPSNEVEYCYFK